MILSPFPLYVLILIFTPLAFGAVDPWAMAIIQVMVACSFLLYCFHGRRESGNVYQVPGTIPLLLFLLWIVLQLLPLPPSLVHFLSPAGYEVYRPVHDLFDGNRLMPITVHQKATAKELLRLTAYFFFYYLTVQLLSSKERLRKIVKIIIWLATFIGVLAIVQQLTSPQKIYWFRFVATSGHPFGPWPFHTNFAAFMEMICPLALALFLYYRPSVSSNESLRIRIASLFSMPASSSHFLMGISLVVIAASVFMSLSRSGIIIVCAASIFYMFQVSTKRTQDIRLISTILFFSGILLLIWFKWDQVSAGLDPTLHQTGRVGENLLGVWNDALNIIRNFPITGTGFGTFPLVLTGYSTISQTAAYHHAHNDYIELLSDGGVIGFILVGWFILAIMLHGWKMLRRRKDNYAILITFAAGTGIVSMLVHSLADFSLHNGAVGLYFFFVCGLLVAAVNTRRHFRTRPSMLPAAGSGRKTVLTLATLIFLLVTLLFQGGRLMARRHYTEYLHLQTEERIAEEDMATAVDLLVKAGKYDPLEGRYRAEIGRLLTSQDQPEEALEQFKIAAYRNPLAGAYFQQIGMLLAAKDPEKAKKIMAEGYARAASREEVVVPWALWLLENNNRKQAIEVLKSGIDFEPTLITRIIPILKNYSFDQQEMTTILSDSIEAWIEYGKYLEEQGDMEAAEFYRRGALQFLDSADRIKPFYFDQLYEFYRHRKNGDKALSVLRRAVEKLPGEPMFHERLGDYYRQAGIAYRAKEEYEKVLVLMPGNEDVRRKLEELRRGSRFDTFRLAPVSGEENGIQQ